MIYRKCAKSSLIVSMAVIMMCMLDSSCYKQVAPSFNKYCQASRQKGQELSLENIAQDGNKLAKLYLQKEKSIIKQINIVGDMLSKNDRMHYYRLFADKTKSRTWLYNNTVLKQEIKKIFSKYKYLSLINCQYAGRSGIAMLCKRTGADSFQVRLEETDAVGYINDYSGKGSMIIYCDGNSISTETGKGNYGLKASVLILSWQTSLTYGQENCLSSDCKSCVCANF